MPACFDVYKVVVDTGEYYKSCFFPNGPLLSDRQKCGSVPMAPNGAKGWYAFLEYTDALKDCIENEVVIICFVQRAWIIEAGEDHKGRPVGRFREMVFPAHPHTISPAIAKSDVQAEVI